jgi:AcrR family transcriptional regulator
MRTRDEKKELMVKEKAISMLNKLGFDGFSMQKLAKEAKISPATLYIYYNDKEDLVAKIASELGKKIADASLEGFSPEMTFAEGLKKQWENRAKFFIENPKEASCFDVIRHAPQCAFLNKEMSDRFRPVMEKFIRNAVRNGELADMPLEVYWAIAYGPIYTLIRFHQDGMSKGNRPFTFSKKIMDQTLARALKALHP